MNEPRPTANHFALAPILIFTCNAWHIGARGRQCIGPHEAGLGCCLRGCPKILDAMVAVLHAVPPASSSDALNADRFGSASPSLVSFFPPRAGGFSLCGVAIPTTPVGADMTFRISPNRKTCFLPHALSPSGGLGDSLGCVCLALPCRVSAFYSAALLDFDISGHSSRLKRLLTCRLRCDFEGRQSDWSFFRAV